MRGWHVFRISVLWLADNLPTALRVSLLPYCAVVAFELWITFAWPGETFAPGNGMAAGFALASFAHVIFEIVVSLWIAIVWHRHLLLAEPVMGWVPPFHKDVFGGYVTRMMGIGLITVGAILVVGMLTAPFAVLFGASSVMQVSPILGIFVATLLFYRFALVLPAIALGKTLEFGDAWRAGEGWMRDLVILVALVLGLSEGLNFAVWLDNGPSAITPYYTAVVAWISLMLGATVLTTLYGHLIEGHALD
jgi:hypothetical protein